jgi:hypothetical protein
MSLPTPADTVSVRRTANIEDLTCKPMERFDLDHPFAGNPLGKMPTA